MPGAPFSRSLNVAASFAGGRGPPGPGQRTQRALSSRSPTSLDTKPSSGRRPGSGARSLAAWCARSTVLPAYALASVPSLELVVVHRPAPLTEPRGVGRGRNARLRAGRRCPPARTAPAAIAPGRGADPSCRRSPPIGRSNAAPDSRCRSSLAHLVRWNLLLSSDIFRESSAYLQLSFREGCQTFP